MTDDFIITYADGLVINLKDKDLNEWEPCTCECHQHPNSMHHIMPCCNNGWKKKKKDVKV